MVLQDLNDALDAEEKTRSGLDESGEVNGDRGPEEDGYEFEKGTETVHPRSLEYLIANQGISRSRNRVPRDDDTEDTVGTWEDSLEAVSMLP